MDAYIFDVDGVITDPQTRVIKHPEITSIIIKLLQNQNPVAFISGRTLVWLKQRIINVLENFAKTNNLPLEIFKHMYVSGEFGTCETLFKNGQFSEIKNPNFVLKKELVANAKKATQNFSDIVFIDKEKQTHFTCEVYEDVPVSEFSKIEHEIATKYLKIIENLGLSQEYEVLEDRLGVSIKHKSANKNFATGQFLNWIKNNDFKPKVYKAFGDTPYDLEIGEELKKTGVKFEFIYTGNPADIKGNISFPIVSTLVKFGKEMDEGTLEYLNSNIT